MYTCESKDELLDLTGLHVPDRVDVCLRLFCDRVLLVPDCLNHARARRQN